MIVLVGNKNQPGREKNDSNKNQLTLLNQQIDIKRWAVARVPNRLQKPEPVQALIFAAPVAPCDKRHWDAFIISSFVLLH